MTIEEKAPKKRGRPPKSPADGARPTFNFRLRQSLRDRLEAAALVADRSLSEEIERRVELSFRDPEIRSMFVGSNRTADLLSMIANILKVARTPDGSDWSEDDEMCNIVASAVSHLILSGATGMPRSYYFGLSEEARSKVEKTALNLAWSAALLQKAIQDNSSVDNIPDPAKFVEKHITPRHLRSAEIKKLKNSFLAYPWGTKSY